MARARKPRLYHSIIRETAAATFPDVKDARSAFAWLKTFRRRCSETWPADRECFVLLLLDTRHRALGGHVVSIGGLNSATVHPREVFAPALLAGAAALIVAHNHPSGDPTPSHEDGQITERLRQAGELMGIPVLDHLVIADGKRGKAYSFAEEGLIA